jgi:Hemerythrin HHE cation binding domain
MTQTANVMTELAREHDEIDGLATRVAALDPGPERTTCVHELCARFVVHVQAEERYLHPAIRLRLRDGAAAAASQACRDRAVARGVESVEGGQAEGDEFDVLVARLLLGVQDHVERQDAVLLPALTAACSPGELDRLGEQVHEGILVARQAAGRAGTRMRERAALEARDGGRAASAPSEDEPRSRGFRALLQRMAGPAPDMVGRPSAQRCR